MDLAHETARNLIKNQIICSMRRNERHFSYIFRIRNKSHQNIGQYESQCIDW